MAQPAQHLHRTDLHEPGQFTVEIVEELSGEERLRLLRMIDQQIAQDGRPMEGVPGI